MDNEMEINSSFIQSQHPVVEELLTNKNFGDTLLICANGHLTDNKLAVGLLFPSLLTSDIFALPIENVLLVPDYTMEEIGREFEKLVLGGSFHVKLGEASQQQSTTPTTSTSSSSSSTSTPSQQQHSTSAAVDIHHSVDNSTTNSESSSQSQALDDQSLENEHHHTSDHVNQQSSESGLQHSQAVDCVPGKGAPSNSSVYMSPANKSDSRHQHLSYTPSPSYQMEWYDRSDQGSVQSVQSPAHSVQAVQSHAHSVQTVQQQSTTPAIMPHHQHHQQPQTTSIHPSVTQHHPHQGAAGPSLPPPPVQALPSQSVPPSPLHHSIPPSPASHQVLQPSGPMTHHQLVPGSPVQAQHQQLLPASPHQQVVQASPAPHQQVVQTAPAPHQQVVQASPAQHPTYTTQYRVVASTLGQYPSNNTVPYTPQPYTNTLQYQELGNVQPVVTVQSVQNVQPGIQPVISVQSVQPVSTVQQMMSVQSSQLVSTEGGTSTTYTNLNYDTSHQDQDYIITDMQVPEDESETEVDENIPIYSEKLDHSQEVTLRNGYTENCENIRVATNSSQDNNSIIFYLQQDGKKGGESSSSVCTPASTSRSNSKKKSVTFKEPVKSKGRRRGKQTLRIEECEDTNVEMIENLKDKESPVLEDRRPGRPRSKPRPPDSKPSDAGGITRFKMLSAQNVTKGKYKCTECEKVLSCQSSLNRHMLVHTDGKPYKCKFCSKAFRENSKKMTHERVHTGSKPFPCKVCSQSFRTATQRRVHMFRHTKESPWTCEVCNTKFAQQFTLKKHKQKRNH